LSDPFAKGKIVTTPVLANSKETFYVKTSGCAQNQFVSMDVYPSPSINVVPDFQYTTVCWGEGCHMGASGCYYFEWQYVPGYNGYDYFFNNTTCATDTVIKMKVVGYSNNQGCPDTAEVQLHLLPKPEFTCSVNPTHFCKGETVTLTAYGPTIKTYTWDTGENTPQIKVPAGDWPIYFNVNAQDSLGCRANAFAELHHQSPKVNVLSETQSICEGDSILMIALGAGSYTWSSGETSNPVWLKPKANREYAVTGSAFGCSTTAIFSVEVTVCTDAPEASEKRRLDFYPNPTTGKIQFISDELETIEVLDIRGQRIKTISVLPGNNIVDLELRQGIYFLSAKGILPRKIIITE
jgi:hypothetical protein